MAKPEIIIIRESLGLSIARDTVTVGSLIGAAALGVWMGSSALQWIGCILVLMHGVNKTELGRHLTIPEARKKLNEIERAAHLGEGKA